MSNIKVGDLVMVVKPTPCCGDAGGCGTVFIVESFERDRVFCTANLTWATVIVAIGESEEFDVERLVRMNPLSEPEQTEPYEPVTA